jgi:hypothetical protein
MAYYLILAGFLAAAGIGYRIRNRWEFPGKLLMIAGGLGCVGLIIWQVRGAIAGSSTPQLDRYHAAASYTLASHVARQTAGQRGQVVLIYPPERFMDSEAMAAMTYAFARVLQSSPSLQLRVTNLVATGKSNKRGQFSLAAFEQACAARSNEVAYVSFAGVPAGIEELSILKQGRAPQLFVFDPLGTTNWLAGLKLGVIRRVVVPRPDAQPARNVEVDGRPDEIFQRYFLMATPETADQVTAQLNTK